MSAFMHSQEHLRVLVWAGLQVRRHAGEDALRWSTTAFQPLGESTLAPASGISEVFGYRYRELVGDSAEAVFQMLVAANADSIVARYGERAWTEGDLEGVGAYTYAPPADREWSDREVVQAIHSFEYQACEVQDFGMTEASAFCRALERRMVDRWLGRDPGLQTAWSIDGHDRSIAGRARVAVEQAQRDELAARRRKQAEDARPEPVVGMPGTMQVGSDRYPFTVIEVKANKAGRAYELVAQRAHAQGKPGSSNHSTELQQWDIVADPWGETETFTRRESGDWRVKGQPSRWASRLMLGVSDSYLDPSF